MLLTQIGAKAGGNFPDWYDAGKELQKNSNIPLGEQSGAGAPWIGLAGIPGRGRWQRSREATQEWRRQQQFP